MSWAWLGGALALAVAGACGDDAADAAATDGDIEEPDETDTDAERP